MSDYNTKLVILGDPGVGKTCLINRKTNKGYNEDTASTSGVCYSQFKVVLNNKKTVTFDCWDTAGQEKYRSMGKSFYKDAFVIIMVYDITNLESFNHLKDSWYPDIKNYGEQYTVLIVAGAKSDLINEEQAPEDEARKWAKEIGAGFILTSSKDNIGIDELFAMAAELFVRPDFIEKYQNSPSVKERIKSITLNRDNHKDDNNNGKDNNTKVIVKKKKKFLCF